MIVSKESKKAYRAYRFRRTCSALGFASIILLYIFMFATAITHFDFADEIIWLAVAAITFWLPELFHDVTKQCHPSKDVADAVLTTFYRGNDE